MGLATNQGTTDYILVVIQNVDIHQQTITGQFVLVLTMDGNSACND